MKEKKAAGSASGGFFMCSAGVCRNVMDAARAAHEQDVARTTQPR